MGIYRWYSAALLAVILSTSANAAVVVAVPKKSVEDLLKAANPVLNENPLGYVQAYDSPFQYQSKPYSVPVQQKITIPTPAIKEALKGALKQQAAVAVASAAISAAVAAAGWVIDEAGKPVKKVDEPVADTSDPNTYVWKANGQKFSTAKEGCEKVAETLANNQLGGSGAVLDKSDLSQINETSMRCTWEAHPSWDKTYKMADSFVLNRDGNSCPANTTYSPTFGGCTGSGYRALTDADYDTLGPVIDSQSAPFRARLAKEACEASLAPARCYQSLQNAASFLNSGPSSMQGPVSNSTTTNKNADGTISTTTTTTDTKFKNEYTSDGVTVKPEKTTTTKNPDGSSSETVDKEEDNSTPGKTTEKDEDKEDPLDKKYTFTNPDLPKVPSFYEQKYPDGLQTVWDANKQRFDNSAFITFLKSFVPNFSGSCPTWGLAMNIMAQASYGYFTFVNLCYVFEFVKVIIMATSLFAARQIMFGG